LQVQRGVRLTDRTLDAEGNRVERLRGIN